MEKRSQLHCRSGSSGSCWRSLRSSCMLSAAHACTKSGCPINWGAEDNQASLSQGLVPSPHRFPQLAAAGAVPARTPLFCRSWRRCHSESRRPSLHCPSRASFWCSSAAGRQSALCWPSANSAGARASPCSHPSPCGTVRQAPVASHQL